MKNWVPLALVNVVEFAPGQKTPLGVGDAAIDENVELEEGTMLEEPAVEDEED